ncbi:pyrimidine reductase family protein [Saccharothrix texasensis]|uniref:Riboflavin biosynthesis pyrimidine reductase n=1 Tax=Saccharothrix texasensis TaxID=103734 RepID=A0A3N1H4F6_9PSEU|nr:pyrimidine reductase family protein [Saccharothrix texasensis]ROP37400.1 riboflavin biosynthesis pyrimidine reductase [Saccharothrix texasensis]
MLWPPRDGEITDEDLERLYDYPAGLDRPWVQVNFVSSVDGAVSVAGRSAGLGNEADRAVFMLGRDLCDVVLVGAGTALVEGYQGIKAGEVRASRRARLGLAPVPPIAVVTGRCSIEPTSALLTAATVPPIILTTRAAPRERRDALAAAGADVVVAGEQTVALDLALAALRERGLLRVDCEGGPKVFGALIDADLVDVLCVTFSPLLAGGDAGRISNGPLPPSPRSMELASVLHHDSALLLRYRKVTPDPVTWSTSPR